MTAGTSKRFEGLHRSIAVEALQPGDLMRIYTDIAAFEGALAHVVANARASAR